MMASILGLMLGGQEAEAAPQLTSLQKALNERKSVVQKKASPLTKASNPQPKAAPQSSESSSMPAQPQNPYGDRGLAKNSELQEQLKAMGILTADEVGQVVPQARALEYASRDPYEQVSKGRLNQLISNLTSSLSDEMGKRTYGLDSAGLDRASARQAATKITGAKNSTRADELVKQISSLMGEERLYTKQSREGMEDAYKTVLYPKLMTHFTQSTMPSKINPNTGRNVETINAGQLGKTTEEYADSRLVASGAEQAEKLVDKMNKAKDAREYMRIATELGTLTAQLMPSMRRMQGTGANLSVAELENLQQSIPGSSSGLLYSQIANPNMPLSLIKKAFNLSNTKALFSRARAANASNVKIAEAKYSSFNRPAAQGAAKTQKEAVDTAIAEQYQSGANLSKSRYGK